MAELAEIVHLGWERPLLETASQWLADRYATAELGGGIDLSGLVIVTPGRRFGRQLLAELAEIGETRGVWVTPGSVITPGEFCGVLLGDRVEKKESAIVRAVAWGRALRELQRSAFESILRRRPEDEAAGEWMRLGELMDSTVGELARELMLPGEMPERCPTLKQFGEEKKWEAIEQARERYQLLLNDCGLEDAHLSHLARIAAMKNESRSPNDERKEIVLVGVVEFDKASRAALEMSGRVVRSLVFAPTTAATRLDSLGCVRPAEYANAGNRKLPLPAAAIEFAEDIADLSRRAIGRIAAWTQEHKGMTARDVSVCAPEPAITRELRLAAENIPGLAIHDAAGEEIGKRSVVKLLARVSEHLREGSVETLARIVKRPEVERWVAQKLQETGESELKWIRRLDEDAVLSPGADASELGSITARAGQLVDELLGIGQKYADLKEHLHAIAAMLERVLAGIEIDEREAEAIALIATTMTELEIASAFAGDMPGWRAVELVLAAIESGTTAVEARRGTVEVLGWLEAAVDRAPFMVIAGLNEGMVPRGKVEDSLLPETVRRSLGMPTGETRAARDAFLFEGLLRSRHKAGGVWAIVAKKDAEGNPLKPSRFIFECDDDAAMERVARLTSEIPEPARFAAQRLEQDTDAKAENTAFPLAPIHTMEPPKEIRATAFADYLSSPYLFFLKHVAKVKEIEESANEVDQLVMGTVIHDVLKAFKGSGLEASTKAASIEEWALAGLEAQMQGMPAKKLAAVREIQIEVAKRRLKTFARLQAEHAADGWQIAETEWEPSKDVILKVSGGSVKLLGRIDRIDRRGDEWRVLDYKTGEKADSPDKKHFKGRIKQQRWINLQLPLYAAILRMSGKIDDGAQVGFFLLPKKSEEGEIAVAGWSKEQFAEAEERAKAIVEAVLRGDFDMGDEPREGGAIARLCGVTLIEASDEEGEE